MPGAFNSRVEAAVRRHLPQAVVTKRGEPILIRALDEKLRPGLVAMYLAYQPRDSFQGLPPVSDEACVRWVEGMMERGVHLVALEFGEGVVGHAALLPIDGRRCEYFTVVAPAFQNVGIGTHLTRCAVQLAYDIGYESIWLAVEPTNVRARHVYKKCGFEYLVADDPHELEMHLDLRAYHEVVSVPVEVLMNRDVVSIPPGTTCRAAVAIFLSRRVASLPVVDESGRLLGILSESDLMVPSNLEKRACDIFTRDVLFVRRTCRLARVVRMFQSKKVRSIPVLDEEDRLVGIIGRRDVLRYYVGQPALG